MFGWYSSKFSTSVLHGIDLIDEWKPLSYLAEKWFVCRAVLGLFGAWFLYLPILYTVSFWTTQAYDRKLWWSVCQRGFFSSIWNCVTMESSMGISLTIIAVSGVDVRGACRILGGVNFHVSFSYLGYQGLLYIYCECCILGGYWICDWSFYLVHYFSSIANHVGRSVSDWYTRSSILICVHRYYRFVVTAQGGGYHVAGQT